MIKMQRIRGKAPRIILSCLGDHSCFVLYFQNRLAPYVTVGSIMGVEEGVEKSMHLIGTVAALSNISIRTLRYYDEIGLLPAKKNPQGHRLYSDEDISKLHYILTLRNLGLPLTDIQSAVSNNTRNVRDVLKMRLQMIDSEKKRLKAMEDSIVSLLAIAEIDQHTDWASIFETFYKFPNSKDAMKTLWAEQFTDEELTTLTDLPSLGGLGAQSDATLSLLKDVRANLHIDPSSATAQKLAKRWILLVEDMYQGNITLANKVWQASQYEKTVGFYQFEEELVKFIEQAIQHYYETQDNKL